MQTVDPRGSGVFRGPNPVLSIKGFKYIRQVPFLVNHEGSIKSSYSGSNIIIQCELVAFAYWDEKGESRVTNFKLVIMIDQKELSLPVISKALDWKNRDSDGTPVGAPCVVDPTKKSHSTSLCSTNNGTGGHWGLHLYKIFNVTAALFWVKKGRL